MAGQIRYEKGKVTVKREPGKGGLKLGQESERISELSDIYCNILIPIIKLIKQYQTYVPRNLDSLHNEKYDALGRM